MNTWQRRAVLGFISLAVVLILGRWLALFLTERWWRSELASGVAAFGMWWSLLGTGLKLLAIFLAFVWFSLHLLAAMRGAVAGDPSGEIAPRRLSTIPERTLRWGTIGIAAILGISVGSGVSAWTPDIVLASHGVHFGISEAAFARDVGSYVSGLAVWVHLHEYLQRLVFLALAGAVLAYGLGGALAIRRGRILIAPGAQRHIGLLGAALAACIVWWYLLMPQLLAAGNPVVVPPVQIRLQETLALLLAGAAAGVAVLTLAWGFRATRMTAIASWIFLLIAMAVVGFLVPPDPGGESENQAWERSRQQLESLSYGIRVGGRTDTLGVDPEPDSLTSNDPQVWEMEQALRMVGAADTLPVRWAGRGWAEDEAGEPEEVWWIVGEGQDSLSLFAVSNERTTRVGDPVFLPGTPTGIVQPAIRLPTTAVRPSAPRYVISSDSGAGGVRAGPWPRRLMLAWALQGRSVLGAPGGARVRWHLDPVRRLRSIAPFADWTGVRLEQVGGQFVWLVDGFVVSNFMPASRRLMWRGRTVAFARAEFLAMVSAVDGTIRLYLRPEASPLGRAWAAIAMPMIGPASDIPSGVLARHPYPLDGALLQAQLFGVPSPEGRGTQWAIPVLGSEGATLDGLLFTPRADAVGPPIPLYRAADSSLSHLTGSSLEPRWNRNPLLRQLRDSVSAIGGAFRLGTLRYAVTHRGVTAYLPIYSDRENGRPVVLAVAIAGANRLAVDRTLEGAIETLRGTKAPELSAGPDYLLAQARIWLQLADSALRRGDLAAFGQAFQALRALLPP